MMMMIMMMITTTTKGYQDQLLLSKTILEDCKKRKNINIAWIDYQKAFNSVPHIWIEKSLEMLGANNKIVKFCTSSVEKWSTKLQYRIH
jgi:hypothetical protein